MKILNNVVVVDQITSSSCGEIVVVVVVDSVGNATLPRNTLCCICIDIQYIFCFHYVNSLCKKVLQASYIYVCKNLIFDFVNRPVRVIKPARAPLNLRFAALGASSRFPVISFRLMSGMGCKPYAASVLSISFSSIFLSSS